MQPSGTGDQPSGEDVPDLGLLGRSTRLDLGSLGVDPFLLGLHGWGGKVLDPSRFASVTIPENYRRFVKLWIGYADHNGSTVGHLRQAL